jgi:hypothetical protein
MTDDQILQSEAWAAFEEMRKAKGKRAPFTALARKRILFELRRMDADGQDVDEVLWTSVTNGWSGVFPIRRKGWQPVPQGLTVPADPSAGSELDRMRRHRESLEANRAASDAARREAMARIGR